MAGLVMYMPRVPCLLLHHILGKPMLNAQRWGRGGGEEESGIRQRGGGETSDVIDGWLGDALTSGAGEAGRRRRGSDAWRGGRGLRQDCWRGRMGILRTRRDYRVIFIGNIRGNLGRELAQNFQHPIRTPSSISAASSHAV